MKKIYYLLVAFLIIIPIGLFAQDYPLRVVITNKGNFTPHIGEFKENPTKYVDVTVFNSGANAKLRNIYFELSIKRLSPSQDVSLLSNKFIKPNVGISVNANSSTKITQSQMYDNFAMHSITDFRTEGIELDVTTDISDMTDNLKLPEGMYQVCLLAYDFDTPAHEDPILLSDPNSSCTVVNICYKAGNPKWIEPVLCQNDVDCYDKEVEPKRMIRFSWTPIKNSCGVNLGKVDYTLKLFNILEGQTADEAATFNTPKYMWENISSTSLTVDTMLVQGIFVQGEKYAIQVYVEPEHTSRISQSLELENEGRSKTVSFIYGKKDIAEDEDEEEEDDEEKDKNKFDQEVNRDIQLVLTNVDCGVPLPANQTPIDTLKPNDLVMIDKFTLKINEVTRDDSTKLYRGNGIISKPIVGDFEYFNWVDVVVEFDSLAVNTDKRAFGGFARAVYSNKLNTDFREFFKSFDSWPNWAQKYCGIGATEVANQAQESAKKYVNDFQGEANVVMQMFNLSYQSLPIKIRHNIAGYDFDVAISDMKFTPRGSTFSMLYFLQIPNVNQVLPFGIRNVCMNGNPIQNGEFCLLADVEIPFGDNKKMVLRGGIPSGGEKARTYIKWSINGYEGVSLDAAIRFYKGSGITNVDESKQFVDVSLSTEFLTWDNWIANISMDEFKVDGLPDFSFKVDTAYYDHSISQNHDSYKDAAELLHQHVNSIKYNNEFTGFFLKELTCKAKTFASDKPLEFSVLNSIINDNGISLLIESTNLLNLETGIAGGWQFSIDTLKVLIVNSSFCKGAMKGKMKIPLNENDSHMGYTCVLSYPEGKSLEYRMSVIPTIEYNFFKYFTAKINNTSSIDIIATGDSVIVTGKFNGEISTRDCLLNLELVGFRDMIISNWDEKNNKKDFVFSFGNWEFAGFSVSEKPKDENKEQSGTKRISGSKKKNKDSSKPLCSVKVGPFKAVVGKIKPDANNLDLSNITDIPSELQAAKNKGKLGGKQFVLTIETDVNLGFGDDKMAGGSVDNSFNFNVLYDKSFKAAPKLSYSHYNIDSIFIKGEFGIVSLNGKLGFLKKDNEKSIFGEGVAGKVNCDFPMNISATAEVHFGKKSDNCKYFGVFGSLKFGDHGITLADPLVINGFGIGFWKNMVLNSDINEETDFKLRPIENNNSSWGFEGKLFFSLKEIAGGKNALNGYAKLSGQVQNGALEKIGFTGNVSALGNFDDKYKEIIDKSLMKVSEEVKDDERSDKYCIQGFLDIGYNHRLKQFHLKTDCVTDFLFVKANTFLEILVDGKNNKWLVAVGKPMYENKDSVIRVSSGLDLGVVKMKSEFMGYLIAGNRLEYNMPPIPDEILVMLDEKPSRKWPESTSAGFMLGCRFNLEFDFTFGPLYAGLEALIGFDMSFKNEKGKQCADGTAIQGMKGYYLRGQMYAYLSGSIGVKLKMFGINKKWNLCTITCGGYLKGALPNPSFLKGAVAVRASLFDGLISFNTKARFTLGKECKAPSADPLADFILVEEVTPGYDNVTEANNEKVKPSIFVTPKARFNAPINQHFNILVDEESYRTYIFRQESYEIVKIAEKGSNKIGNPKPVSFTNTTNSKHGMTNTSYREFEYDIDGALDPHSTYKMTIVCTVREVDRKTNTEDFPIDANGIRYHKDSATIIKVVYFSTGAMPNTVVVDNIYNAYPFENQYETYVNSNNGKGFILLSEGQDNLFEKKDPQLGDQALFLTLENLSDPSDKIINLNYKYTTASKYDKAKIEYTFPKLKQGSIYRISFYVAEKIDNQEAKYDLVTKEGRLEDADSTMNKEIEEGDENIKTFSRIVDINTLLKKDKKSDNSGGSNKGKTMLDIIHEENEADLKGRKVEDLDVAGAEEIKGKGTVLGGGKQGILAGSKYAGHILVTEDSKIGSIKIQQLGNPTTNFDVNKKIKSNGKYKKKTIANTMFSSNPSSDNNSYSNSGGSISDVESFFNNAKKRWVANTSSSSNDEVAEIVKSKTINIGNVHDENNNELKMKRTKYDYMNITGNKNEQSSELVEASFANDTTKFSREESIRVDKDGIGMGGKEVRLVRIFEYHFRTSSAFDLDAKCQAARISSGGFKKDNQRYIRWESSVRDNAITIDYEIRRLAIQCKYPSSTTTDDMFPSRAFTGETGYASNCIENPPFISLKVDLKNKPGNARNYWEEFVARFLSAAKNKELLKKLYLPFTAQGVEISSYMFDKYANSLYIYDNNSFDINNFQSRLTNDEISSGKVFRSSISPKVTWYAIHEDFYATHFLWASNLADEICLNQERRKYIKIFENDNNKDYILQCDDLSKARKHINELPNCVPLDIFWDKIREGNKLKLSNLPGHKDVERGVPYGPDLQIKVMYQDINDIVPRSSKVWYYNESFDKVTESEIFIIK